MDETATYTGAFVWALGKLAFEQGVSMQRRGERHDHLPTVMHGCHLHTLGVDCMRMARRGQLVEINAPSCLLLFNTPEGKLVPVLVNGTVMPGDVRMYVVDSGTVSPDSLGGRRPFVGVLRKLQQ